MNVRLNLPWHVGERHSETDIYDAKGNWIATTYYDGYKRKTGPKPREIAMAAEIARLANLATTPALPSRDRPSETMFDLQQKTQPGEKP